MMITTLIRIVSALISNVMLIAMISISFVVISDCTKLRNMMKIIRLFLKH